MAEMLTPDHTIEVFCDDPRHARGKIAKLETFRRFSTDDGRWWWLARRENMARDDDGTYWSRHRPGWPAGSLESLHHSARDRLRYECNLCSATRPRGQAPLECTEETLQWLLESVWQGMLKLGAEQDVSRVNLQTLNLVASNRPQQQ
jgi:hypothetical protein